MLTEKDYCDYDTCVALKELGYPTKMTFIGEQATIEIPINSGLIQLYEAQKWLREEKKLFIEITIGAFDQTYLWEIYATEASNWRAGGHSSSDTYEEALSEGIKEAVKIFKEK